MIKIIIVSLTIILFVGCGSENSNVNNEKVDIERNQNKIEKKIKPEKIVKKSEKLNFVNGISSSKEKITSNKLNIKKKEKKVESSINLLKNNLVEKYYKAKKLTVKVTDSAIEGIKVFIDDTYEEIDQIKKDIAKMKGKKK